jgi:hypothetical protein
LLERIPGRDSGEENSRKNGKEWLGAVKRQLENLDEAETIQQ